MMFGRRKNRKRRSWTDRIRAAWNRVASVGRRYGPWVLLAAVAVGVAVLAYLGATKAISSPYFQVSDIEIRGVEHADIESLAEEAGLRHGVNVFEVDTGRAAEELESSPWIREATVERVLPDGISVRVEERRPGALLVDGVMYVVDRGGAVVEALPSDRREPFLELPLVTGVTRNELEDDLGRELMREAMKVAELYDELGLAEERPLSEIHVDPVLGLTLTVEGTATEIRLGRGKYRARLERLGDVRRALEARGVEPAYLLLHRKSLERVTVGRRRSQGRSSEAGGSGMDESDGKNQGR